MGYIISDEGITADQDKIRHIGILSRYKVFLGCVIIIKSPTELLNFNGLAAVMSENGVEMGIVFA